MGDFSGEIACDACGPVKHGQSCGIAYVYRSLAGWWHADFTPLKKDTDATALELQAVAMGLDFLWGSPSTQMREPEITLYSDASRLFEYLTGTRIVPRHEPVMERINTRVSDLYEWSGVVVKFEQVHKHERIRYPLYLMADALTRHARTLPLA